MRAYEVSVAVILATSDLLFLKNLQVIREIRYARYTKLLSFEIVWWRFSQYVKGCLKSCGCKLTKGWIFSMSCKAVPHVLKTMRLSMNITACFNYTAHYRLVCACVFFKKKVIVQIPLLIGFETFVNNLLSY